MTDVAITSVRFRNFKALRNFSVSLRDMNVLVGPNNCGKSTILSAFRVLEQALRPARARRATRVYSHTGHPTNGHIVPEASIPISLENVHSDYADEDSRIEFRFSNGNILYLYFPRDGGCSIYWETQGRLAATAAAFRREFPIQVQVIPVLGPIEQEEHIVTDETVKRAAGTPRASRHFRNYWQKNPEGFDAFRQLVETTWPGMSIGLPEITTLLERRLIMFCSEDRMDRELFWAGLGFQIWCQLLTHISRCSESDVLIVDEPEVYLHPDLQRQLLGILRDVKPDIVVATHSVEILGEAEPDEILLIDKTRGSAKRLRNIEGVQEALNTIGSIQNLTLTELARNRRILFVEGMGDYKILRRFARKLQLLDLGAGAGLTVLESGGFGSWERVQALSWGFNQTLGSGLKIAAIYDRDYRSDMETESLLESLRKEIHFAHFHRRKEVENYLLVPAVLQRVASKLIESRSADADPAAELNIKALLDAITNDLKSDCQGQYISKFCEYHKSSGKDAATFTSDAIAWFDEKWGKLNARMEIIPGKPVLRSLRGRLQQEFGITLTDIRIIDGFHEDEIPDDLRSLLHNVDAYRTDGTVT
ncbi:MAG: hypothetical protein DRQ54_08785 [Gammaproteobacteria bacterium]|nr:MAG: hypothetical protein DRQ54_08785 [Gammaproteobacteria bacterium]